jgi:hypothetical protein
MAAFNIDPPASSYAIMRRASPYRGENSGPGKDGEQQWCTMLDWTCRQSCPARENGGDKDNAGGSRPAIGLDRSANHHGPNHLTEIAALHRETDDNRRQRSGAGTGVTGVTTEDMAAFRVVPRGGTGGTDDAAGSTGSLRSSTRMTSGSPGNTGTPAKRYCYSKYFAIPETGNVLGRLHCTRLPTVLGAGRQRLAFAL